MSCSEPAGGHIMRTAGRNRDTARGDLEAPSPLFSTLRPTLILRGKVAVNQSLKLLLLGLTPFVAGTALNAAIPTVFQSFSVLHSTVLLGVWGFMSYKIRSPKDTALETLYPSMFLRSLYSC